MSLEDTAYKYMPSAFCSTEPLLKTYHYKWIINKFWLTYNFTTTINAGTTNEIPFTLHMIKDAIKRKICFVVRSIFENNAVKCNIHLESVKTSEILELLCRIDGEQLYYELDLHYLLSQEDKYLSDGALRVYCKFNCLQQFVHKVVQTNIIQEGEELCQKELPSDPSDSHATIIFKVEELTYRVSKDLLCVKSGHFKSLDISNALENIIVEEEMPDVIEKFVIFIESNVVPNIENTSLDILYSLFLMAKKYDVKNLLTICEQYIKKFVLNSLFRENFERTLLEILLFAEDYGAKELLNFTASYVALNIKKIMEDESFSHIVQLRPKLFTQITEAKFLTQGAIHVS